MNIINSELLTWNNNKISHKTCSPVNISCLMTCFLFFHSVLLSKLPPYIATHIANMTKNFEAAVYKNSTLFIQYQFISLNIEYQKLKMLNFKNMNNLL